MIPQRMCVVCRKMKERDELLRVAKIKDEFLVDLTNKAGGRGAYICKTGECLDAARKKSVFERSFSGRVPAEVYDKLEELIKGGK